MWNAADLLCAARDVGCVKNRGYLIVLCTRR